MKPVLIIGCGDIGQRVARLYRQKGAMVFGLARSQESADRLQKLNIKPIRGDLSQPASLQNIVKTCADSSNSSENVSVYYFAPPPGEGITDPYMRNFLAAITHDSLLAKIVQISTTAVYGDCRGAWITEEQPVNPQTERGLRRLDAERALRGWSEKTGVPIVTLRVGGIYGPGRLPIARLQKGLPILREKESPFTNRIHQDDLAQICLAASQRGKAGEVYNVADGQPGTMSGYFRAVAKAAGLPLPPEVSRVEAENLMTPGMLSYLRESRRLDNKKMLKDLDITLRYANLEAGLHGG